MKNTAKKHFLKFLLLIFGSLITTNSQAQTKLPEWQWAIKAGGATSDESNCMVMDSAGNIFVTGFFQGSINLGNITLTSAGGNDIFVAKLDTNGQWQWAASAGGSNYDEGTGIAVDAKGNTYVTGFFRGSASFSKTTLTSTGLSDMFVAKLDSSGKWIWAVNSTSGASFQTQSKSIAIDSTGSAYITGYFQGTAIFGDTTLTSSGDADIFIAKLDSSGKWNWIAKAGSSNFDYGRSIAIDHYGNTYVIGNFRGTATFGAISLAMPGTDDNIFIAKLNSDGNYQWAVKAGGNSLDYGEGITINDSGKICITGSFRSAANFGSTKLSTSSTEADMFVAKLDSNGTWIWAVKAGKTGQEEGLAIIADAPGNIYVAGNFDALITFGSINLPTAGSEDIFVAKLTSNGKWLWAIKAGGEYLDNVRSMSIDKAGNIYMAGLFMNTTTFGTTSLTSTGGKDIFIAKLMEKESSGMQEDQGNNNIIKIYPNPATNNITIESSNRINTPIIITDITGRQVLKPVSINENKLNLDVSALPKGLFFITVNAKTYKFIKQ